MPRYTVLSPDGLPISPETFATEEEADDALLNWCGIYERQGFYSSVDERISLAELPSFCRIVLLPED